MWLLKMAAFDFSESAFSFRDLVEQARLLQGSFNVALKSGLTLYLKYS